MSQKQSTNQKYHPSILPPESQKYKPYRPEVSSNPKDKIGRTKPALHLIPGTALVQEARVMKLGAEKYGPYNWRGKTVAASVYVSAALRHLHAWFDGEDLDDESGASHLAHARACLGILIDAGAQGKLVDDRPEPGKTAEQIRECTEKKVGVDYAEKGGDSTAVSVVPVASPKTPWYNNGERGQTSHTLKDVEPGGRKLSPAEKHRVVASFIHKGCRWSVAHEIARGVTAPRGATNQTPGAYVAGPMRGYVKFNFPAFNEARNRLVKKGWTVISPADIDKASGIDEDDPSEGSQDRQHTFAYRDFHALHYLRPEHGDAIAMLPGWENSAGATAEFFLARWLGLKVLDATTGEPLKMEDIQGVVLLGHVYRNLGT